MTETTKSSGEKLSVTSVKTLTLKRGGGEQGVVRQSFSHGRAKAVVVEKVKRRIQSLALTDEERTAQRLDNIKREARERRARSKRRTGRFSVTDNAQAYNEAVTRVQKAKESGALGLFLADLEALNKIPPLDGLLQLRGLNLAHTIVDNLTPVSAVPWITALNLCDTEVSDLTPIKNLRNIQFLRISGSLVNDLTVIAHMPSLTKGIGGLEFETSIIEDVELHDIGQVDNPECTIQAVAYVRKALGLSESFEKNEVPNTPPELPAQGPGPHFIVRDDGIIDFAPASALDRQGNNIARLRELHPVLRELARSLVESLGRGNAPHAHLSERAQSYCNAIDADLDVISFPRLYGEGVRLMNAAVAANEQIQAKELPSFDAPVREALESVLQLHGTFMLCTADGMELMAAEERYERTPNEEKQFRQAAIEFAQELQNQPHVIDSAAADFVLHAAEEMNLGQHPERSGVVGGGSIRNTSIVVVAGATIATVSSLGPLLVGVPGTILGIVIAAIGMEGLKKTKAFGALSGAITKAVDQVTEADIQAIVSSKSKSLAPYLKFVLKSEDVLRRLAGDRYQFRWLHASLDWIKERTQRE